ncbi:MAG TPA: hypothetical protein VKB67_11890 [Rhizomicrobium sp.]|nr:hypothetical protein [Rhizomicrobium sp.]
MTLESQPNNASGSNNLLPLHLLSKNELMWWPYQSLSKSLLQTHHNASALVEINRRLADEMRNIARLEQDFLFELSERILVRKVKSDKTQAAVMPPETVDEIFESAISGLRQFNQAVVDAQVRSIEAFHRHALDAISQQNQLSEQAKAAE